MQLKNVNLTTTKIHFVKKYVDIANILIFNKSSSGEKNYKQLIGYADDDCKQYQICMHNIRKNILHNALENKRICKELW